MERETERTSCDREFPRRDSSPRKLGSRGFAYVEYLVIAGTVAVGVAAISQALMNDNADAIESASFDVMGVPAP